MPSIVVSYSLTGNNEALAADVAAALGAEHVRITEAKARTNGAIALDMLLGRAPRIEMPPVDWPAYDLVLFVAPVWMFQVAAPLRGCLKAARGQLKRYAFATISGGALGPNTKLGAELTRRLGQAPACVVDLHIADLLPADPKPTRNDTSSYHLNEAEVQVLTDKAVAALHKALAG